ncbi:MAG: hypothetical protein AAFY28_19030, partial [Actinomycetota bacterium]
GMAYNVRPLAAGPFPKERAKQMEHPISVLNGEFGVSIDQVTRRDLADSTAPGTALLAQHFDPAGFMTDAEWRNATQAYQAELLRRQIEVLRRLKYRPTGGFTFTSLHDTTAIGFGVIDVEGNHKAAYDAVRTACAPVIVVAEPLPTAPARGRRLALDVHTVNDTRAPVEDATVEAVLTWPHGTRRWRFGGEIPADDVVLVGRVQFEVPPLAYGDELSLTLTLTTPTVALAPIATNRYATRARS